MLADEELDANAKRFADQAFRILDRGKTEVRFNGEWLAKLSFAEVVRLTRMLTVSRLLERDDFAKRFAAQEPISLSELLYPPMQAYDSVAIDADVEIGGTDQLYNLLTGRDVMERYGKEPQLVVTYPLLVGLDGAEKMSKSRGNYIGIDEPPEEMFGKTMSIPDKALPQWWELARRRRRASRRARWSGSSSSRAGSRRAGTGRRARAAGEAHFTRVVRRHEAPGGGAGGELRGEDGDGLPARRSSRTVFGNSASHWRRQIDQGGVKLNGEPVAGYDVAAATRSTARSLQAGKRQFVRFRLAFDSGPAAATMPRLPERAA